MIAIAVLKLGDEDWQKKWLLIPRLALIKYIVIMYFPAVTIQYLSSSSACFSHWNATMWKHLFFKILVFIPTATFANLLSYEGHEQINTGCQMVGNTHMFCLPNSLIIFWLAQSCTPEISRTILYNAFLFHFFLIIAECDMRKMNFYSEQVEQQSRITNLKKKRKR